MGIYRGPGGSGDAVNDSSSETRLAVEARDAALAAQAAAEAAQAAAETAETNAETAETNAETAETNAETAATNAASSASSASTSATNAASSASAASTSATNAANSASSASSSASSASTSASNAASSASSASTSASNAATSATAAQAAQAAAEAAFDAFDDIYLGAKSSNPTVDNDGNALTTGDQYFNTVSNEMRVWNGSTWQSASVIGGTVTSLTVTGATALNGGATLGDASGDALTINSSAVSIPNGLNFDSNTLVIDATNNRVGVGTASPAYNLDVSGSAATIRAIGTSASNPSLILSSSGITAWSQTVSGSDSSISWSKDGTERMRITSTGVVLIGRTAAIGSEVLSVNGISASTNQALFPANSGTTAGTSTISYEPVYLGASGRTQVAKIDFVRPSTSDGNYDGYMAFFTRANGSSIAERMRIDSSGNVGIGTSSPTTFGYNKTLTVADSTSASIGIVAGSDSFYSASSSTGGLLVVGNSKPLVLYTGGSEKMRLDSSGNLGLGVTPSAWSQGRAFEILKQGYGLWNGSGAPASTYMLTNAYFNSGFKYAETGQASHYYQYQGAHVWSTAASGTAGNAITFTQAMTLDSSGNLGIGTSSPSAKLHTVNSSGYPAAFVGQYQAIRLQSLSDRFSISGVDTTLSASYQPLQIQGSTIYFAIGATTSATLDSSGNLGLGVTPSAWASDRKTLQIRAASIQGSASTSDFTEYGTNFYQPASGSELYISSTYASKYTQYQSQHRWYIAPSGTAGNAITFTQAMTLDASGNLGLGVTPSAWNIGKTMQIGSTGNGFLYGSSNGATSSTIYGVNAYYNGGWKYDGSGYSTRYEQSAGSGFHAWYTAPSGTAGNAISFTQAMTLDASGNLGIGTSSPARQLNISGAGSSGTQVQINGTSASAGIKFVPASGDNWEIQADTSSNFAVYNRTDEAYRMVIDSSGNLLVGTTSTPTTAAKVIAMGNATAPTASITGGILYVEGGALKFRGSSGTVTTIAPA